MQLTEKTQVKPILKWVGNKAGTSVAARVKELFEPYRMSHWWVEPFLGVGGMLLDVMPDEALCSDLSPEVVRLHRWIRDGGQYIEFSIADHSTEQYYQRRKQFQKLQAKFTSPDFVGYDEFFSLMIWLNKAGYNGLWRVNASGLLNVPVGKNSKGGLHEVNEAELVSQLQELTKVYKTRRWMFGNNDFEAMSGFMLWDEPKFIYADPPYWGTHSAYTAKPFNWADQERLAHWLNAQDCPVVASNSNHPDILALYQSLGFEIELIEVRRSISCDGNRKPATEMLAHKGCTS